MEIRKIIHDEENLILLCSGDVSEQLTFLRVFNFDVQVPVKRIVVKKKIDAQGNSFFELPRNVLLNKETYPEATWVIEEKISVSYNNNEDFIELPQSLYDIQIIAKEKFNIKLKKKNLNVKLISINFSDKAINFKIKIPEITTNDYTVLLRNRIDETLWQYHDTTIKLSRTEDGCFIITKEILISYINAENCFTWDFFVRINCCDETAGDFRIEAETASFKINLNRDYEFLIYSNNGNTLSATYQRKSKQSFYKLEEYNESTDTITIDVSCKGNTAEKLLLVKKDSFLTNIELCEYCVFSYKEKKNNICRFELPIGKILIDYAKKARETWLCYINNFNEENRIWGGVEESLKSSYISVNDRITGKFYIEKQNNSNLGKLNMYTHFGIFKEYNEKIKVAVFGSCFSRSMFRSDPFFCEDYKIFYDCRFTQFHSSWISLVAPPSEITKYDLFNMIDKKGKKYVEWDFNKLWYEELKKSEPQYIILDLYFDSCQPIINIKDNQYVSLNMYIRYSKFLEELKYLKIIKQNDWNEFFALWKKACRQFLKMLTTVVPEENIILFRGRFVKKYKKSDGSVAAFGNQAKINKDNLYWARMEEYISNHYKKIRFIDMRNTDVIGLENHPLGFSTSHYDSEYYRDALNCFNKIILEDIIKR